MQKNRRIALFFGSFNPIHIGHLAIANYVATFGSFEDVWLVVSPQNPLKINSPQMAEEKHRLLMAGKAIESLELPIKVSDIEFYMPKPSYTINTLDILSKDNPDCEFCVVVGADSLYHFHKWYKYQSILDNYKVYVYPRLGFDAQALCEKYKTSYIDAPVIEVSSTFVRENIMKNNNVNAFVVPEVRMYIEQNKLYKN